MVKITAREESLRVALDPSPSSHTEAPSAMTFSHRNPLGLVSVTDERLASGKVMDRKGAQLPPGIN